MLVKTPAFTAATLALARRLRRALEAIFPRDRLSFAVVSLVLIATGLVACCLPALASMRLDPMDALPRA